MPEGIGNELPDTNLACETNIHEGLQVHLMIDEGEPEGHLHNFCELEENGDYLFSADFLKPWDDDEADPAQREGEWLSPTTPRCRVSKT